MITAHQRMGVDHGQIASILQHLDSGLREATELQYALNRALDRIDADAHDELAAAPPTQRASIIAARHAQALAVHSEFVGGITSLHARMQGRVEPIATGILGRGGAPLDTPPDPTQALDGDPQMRGPKKKGEQHGESGSGGSGATDDPFASNPQLRGNLSGGGITSPPQPPRVMPPSPLTDGGISGAGGIGGMSSGGLGGGLGGGGVGAGTPMSGLSSGLGRASSSAAGGLPSSLSTGGGAPSSAVPGLSQPSAAFSQGLAAGSAGGASFGGVPPAATAAGGGPAASSAGGVPAAGLSAGQATPASASGIGMPGAHAPVPAAGASGGAGAAAPPMMLPSPGMGAPAAPVSPGLSAASVTAPAGTVSGSGGGVPTVASGGVGGAGAALVPAPVVSAGSARPTRAPTESPELLAAKALAIQLRRDGDAALYPVIDWAVGVFRSESGSATETVFMSNEGFGYIPHGVFVPRSARLLTVDPLVDNAFRERWFGWLDPARVLVEYARLRSRGGARLIAAATTSKVVDTLREFGVEHASCPRDYNKPLPAPPVLDDMHTHRLAVQWPELFPRITRLADWNDGAVLNRVMVPLAMEMMDGVRHGGGGVDCPPPLRQMWDALGSGDEIPQKTWEDFALEARLYYTSTSSNPGRDVEADTGGRVVYQAEWLVARTMEVVGGWAHQPPPLTDMAYAAAAACFGDFAAMLDPMLRPLEDEAAGEASANR